MTEPAPTGSCPSWRLLGALLALSCAGCTAETGGTALGKVPLQTSDSGVQGDDDDVDGVDDGDASGSKGEENDAGGGCDLTGTYAMQADMDVTWQGTSIAGVVPVLANGSGKLRITTRLTVEREGGGYIGRVRACSTETPDFASNTVGETYAVRFPESLWEAASMPEWELPIEFACNEPGCTAKSETLYALLGVDLENPAGPWPPNRRDPRLKYRDDDGDGKPGLTIEALDDGTHTYPPVIIVPEQRATQLMLAIRVISLFDGTLTSCDRFEGNGPGTSVETRAAGCIQNDGNVCGETDVPGLYTSAATFLDDNLPKWEVSTARWTVVRLDAGASCEDVRNAAF